MDEQVVTQDQLAELTRAIRDLAEGVRALGTVIHEGNRQRAPKPPVTEAPMAVFID